MERFLTNPRIVILGIALIIVAGLAALQSLPRLEDPYIVNRHSTVLVQLPGASAERVEALLAEPLERRIREIPEVRHLVSHSRAGIVSVSVELIDEVDWESSDRVWAEIRDKLEQAIPDLPADASKPILDSERGYAFTWIAAISWQGKGEPNILLMSRYADELLNRSKGVPYTDLAWLYGAPEEEVRIDVDSVLAASVGLDVVALSRLVAGTDAKVPAGQIDNQQHRMTLEVSGAFSELEQLRRIPVVTGEFGSGLQLQDIAEIYRAERPAPREMAIVDGRRAVVVAVRQQPTVRGDVWTREQQAVAKAFAAELPAELRLEEIFVQERYTRMQLKTLMGNISLGFFLVVTVLFITLGWRAALIVALSLPLTIFFALACMQFFDIPIHQMSVTGLIVSLGIMVDNAIVATDTTMRYRKQGLGRVEAVLRTVRHLWLPLLGSTLTTVLTFMPIVLMPGSAGEFIGPIGYTVIFSILGSWFISIFLVTPVAARYLPRNASGGVNAPLLAKGFDSLLRKSLKAPVMVIALVLLLPVAGFVGSGGLKEQFFPASDRDMIDLEIYLPENASLPATRVATERVGAYIRSKEGVERLHWFIGRSAPSFYYNLLDRRDGAANYAQAMMRLRDQHRAHELAAELQRELDDRFPEYQIIVRRLAQGPPSSAPVELRLTGTDLSQLRELGDQIRRLALHTEDVTHVRASLNDAVAKLWLNVDPVQAELSGMALTDIASKTRFDLDGRIAGSVLEGTEQLPVRVRSGHMQQLGVNALQLMPVMSAGGNSALMGFAELELKSAQGVISRRDSRRANMIEIYVRDGVLPATVLARIRKALDGPEFQLPPGYEIGIGGESEGRSKAVNKLMGSFGIIAVMMTVTVVMAFNSFALAGIVFSVAGQAAGLGLLSLVLSDQPFGFTPIVGLMGLIGLAVNAAIVILIELRQDERALAGDIGAIVHAVSDCGRHIVSTTITTVMGLLPLILAGDGMWTPFAVVLAGGTVLTTMLSMIYVPAAFLLLAKLRRRRHRDEQAPMPAMESL